jgi:zinc resistance-associated protein
MLVPSDEFERGYKAMKKGAILSLAVVAALALSGAASAHMWGDDDWGPGRGRGPGMMYGKGPDSGKPVDIEKFKQFQKETSGLRDEMKVKRLELRNEFLKEKADEERIATLQKEIIDLRTKIHKAADKAGIELPVRGAGRGFGGCDNGPGGCRGGGRGW